ncbi:hypothetical protein CGSMWGv0288E_04461 [Gardnerella vaginalis 0288E]|nr:hypothetical protein CGSMWGv0288E_04461 [Gardnerella vaginalis 0288E]
MKATQLFRLVRGLGDSWSNNIRAAADTKQSNESPLQTNFNPKNKIKTKTEQPQQQTTRKRRSVVRIDDFELHNAREVTSIR